METATNHVSAYTENFLAKEALSPYLESLTLTRLEVYFASPEDGDRATQLAFISCSLPPDVSRSFSSVISLQTAALVNNVKSHKGWLISRTMRKSLSRPQTWRMRGILFSLMTAGIFSRGRTKSISARTTVLHVHSSPTSKELHFYIRARTFHHAKSKLATPRKTFLHFARLISRFTSNCVVARTFFSSFSFSNKQIRFEWCNMHNWRLSCSPFSIVSCFMPPNWVVCFCCCY